MIYSPDGEHLLAYGLHGPWYVYDADDLAAAPRELKLVKPALTAAFTPDGERVVAGSVSGLYAAYEFATGRLVKEFGDSKPGAPRGLAVSADGKRLVATNDESVEIWDLEKYERVASVAEKDRYCGAVAWSPDGSLVATAEIDREKGPTAPRFVVELRDGRTLALMRRLSGHWGTIVSLHFSDDGKKLYSLSGDGTMRIWNPAKLLAESENPPGEASVDRGAPTRRQAERDPK